ncbi:MmcQ/YjbR family DNA-binding protein [Pseudoruegeria sp. HB172150]|uniref:MmcQ/YjbR family DNA-binding protein n=1 Tax=Pseudoruegeria sp. HB172150 TaxID=2721164 RepID=UPI001555A5FB
MTRDEFNAFCGGLAATDHVVQWGNADVWKVGGKVFAICGWNDGRDAFTFKAGDIAFEVLKDAPGIRPAPYLASRGMKWLQHYAAPGLPDGELREHIHASYRMVAEGLSRKKRKELGIELPE